MQNVLITGFPGFIAGELLARLAPRAAEITLLAEARFATPARAAADRIAAAAGVPASRLRIAVGDITRPDLGLAPAAADRLRAEADTVFHLAAIYDLAVAADVAERVNVGGTGNVNAFVAGFAGLERYAYVSTYVVAGRRAGIVREDELEHDAGFHNHYEETKYRAELAVRRLQEQGLPVTIFRPGVVVGSSKDGHTVKFDGPYMLLKAMRRLPWPLTRFNLGSPRMTFQMVPVDFVVDAMAAIAELPAAAGKTFHLTDPDPCSTARIFDLFSRSMFGARSWLRVPPPLVRAVTNTGFAESLGLQRQAAPYFFHPARFDCVNTLDALDGSGIACPHLEDYVEPMVAYFLAHESNGDGR
jgi:thioester reductase-like protein